MREIQIVGIAETKFGKAEGSYRELAVQAGQAALGRCGR